MASVIMSAKRPCAPADDGDRLSALPDALLHSVMSHLTAQQAVQTCALSRRWQDLWRSVPCLDMDSDTFRFKLAPSRGLHAHSEAKQQWEKLKDFANNLFTHHGAPTLDRFRLHICIERNAFHALWEGAADVKDMDRWIRRGFVRYNPVEVSLKFLPSYHMKLPPLASASSRLRRLHLTAMDLDRGFADSVRTGFPVLEDLELSRCACAFLEMVSDSLKSLAIDCCTSPSRRCVRVTVPSLVSLRLVLLLSQFKDGIFLVEADSLVTASITAHSFDGTSAERLRKVFARLVCVMTLKLTNFSKQMGSLFVDEHGNFPKFHRLSTLDLDDCDLAEEFHLLQSFVHNSPSLKKVMLRHHKLHCSKRNRATKATKIFSFKRQNLAISKSQDSTIIQVKYPEDDTCEMFEFLLSIGRKLRLANTIILTKL